MKNQLYEYLIAELYPLPECCNCQYDEVDPSRVPCSKCKIRERYKLRKELQQDVKNLVKGIMNIVKENEKKSKHVWRPYTLD